MAIQPNFKKDDPWTAQLLNELIRQQLAAFNIKSGPGISVRSTGDMQFQVYLSRSQSAYPFKGKTNGAITARSSDAAHGTGTVRIWTLNESSGNWEDSGFDVTVTYMSSTTGGLASGVWVVCAYREDGGAEIISVDCAN